MGVVDFILNLAGLLLWLNWRSDRFDPLMRRVPATLMGTLRPAAPQKLSRWHLLAFLAGLLFVRALIYWWIATEMNWAGKVNLGVVVLWFSSNPHWSGFCHMLLFSFLSFGIMLGTFYVLLLPLSLIGGPMPVQGLVTIPLGRIDGWPRWVKVLLPLLVTALAWWGLSWLLVQMQILPPVTPAGRFQQSVVLGVSSYLLWQYPVEVILLLHLLNSYIYFGRHSFWKYITSTAQILLRPLKKMPLQVGKVDLAPLVGVTLVFLLGCTVKEGIHWHWLNIPGLADIYQKLSR